MKAKTILCFFLSLSSIKSTLGYENLLKENSLRGYQIRRNLQQQKVWVSFCEPSIKRGFFSNQCLRRLEKRKVFEYCTRVSESYSNSAILMGALDLRLTPQCRKAIIESLEKINYLERNQYGKAFE